MSKKVIKIFCVTLIAVLLIGIGCVAYILIKQSKDEDGDTKIVATMVVTSDAWSGWSEDYEVETVTEEFTVKSGDKVKVDDLISDEDFIIKVLEVTEESIVISTRNPMSVSEVDEHGIDLSTDETEFEVEKGEKIKLTTPSTDMGSIFIIEYK
ncbi:MAG: hypothetical protein E7259_02160 [Lachnospiraceae bacterium]|nr:hypothetical protein [Lachnospiraceae bacterium]